ncbi:MAG: tyrosine-type recombinase/integrase [Candidatus Lustribacter sp.]
MSTQLSEGPKRAVRPQCLPLSRARNRRSAQDAQGVSYRLAALGGGRCVTRAPAAGRRSRGLGFHGRGRRPTATGERQERSFRPILKRAELPQFKFHELRHTNASLLAAVPGLHPKVVQERLGHASVGLTLDTYSHLFEGADGGVIAGLDALNLVGS